MSEGPDNDRRPTIRLAGEDCRPNTLFRETATRTIWRLNAWNRWTVTLAEWETEDTSIYPLDGFERAMEDGQFEKIPTVFDF